MMTGTHHRFETALVAAIVTGLAALAAAATALAGRTADMPAWEKALMARSDALNRHYGLGTYADTRNRRHTGFRGPLVVDCRGSMRVGPASPPSGRCTVSGALSDRGWFADSALLGSNPHTRIFRGAKGTIQMQVYLERGHWEIVEGTNAYAGLRGRGWERSSGRCRSPGCVISLTMVGTVEGHGESVGTGTRDVRRATMPAWKRALIARSEALNRYYKLGKYADR